MASERNTPPKGVLIALAIFAGLIIFYFVISAMFPDLFHNLSTGNAAPVTN